MSTGWSLASSPAGWCARVPPGPAGPDNCTAWRDTTGPLRTNGNVHSARKFPFSLLAYFAQRKPFGGHHQKHHKLSLMPRVAKEIGRSAAFQFAVAAVSVHRNVLNQMCGLCFLALVHQRSAYIRALNLNHRPLGIEAERHDIAALAYDQTRFSALDLAGARGI